MPDNKIIHVFLSHNSFDKPQVENIGHRLRDEGFEVWLDKWNLIPGDPWQEGIEKALDACDCCLVFVGQEGNIGPWQNVEMRAAIDHQVSTQRLRVIPVLLPGSERGDPSQLPTFLRRNTWVEFRYSLDEPDTFMRLVAGIKREKPPIEGELVNSENPYRGLEVFDVEHSRFFFGRKAVVEWLLDAIRPSEARDSHARFRDNRFLAVIGASGSGKSSVARAGLLAALKSGQLPGSQCWPQIRFTPGEKPLESLAKNIVPKLPTTCRIDIPNLIDKFLKQPLQLHYLALEWLQGDERQRLVILADQFEEIFTLCRNDVERQAFLDNLLNAAYESTGQVMVILTLRADFYPNLTPYEPLSRAVEAHQYLLNPLNESELREAIILPAQLSKAEVEDLLVDDLVKDTLEQPGSLPLLQFALSRLWEQRSGRVLRLADYREFGGLVGALEQQANKVYERLSTEDQAQCRLVFRRLVQPGEGTTDTRRRARLAEFSEDQQRIVRLMADERLLTTQREEGEEFVEVAHEALIGGWSRLKGWVNEDRASIQTQHLVSSAAKEWEDSKRTVQGLLPEARLLDAQQWVEDYPEQATDLEQAFVASEKRIVRRQRSRVKWFAGVMAVVAAGMVVLTWLLLEQSNKAEENEQKALKQEIDAKHNLGIAHHEKAIFYKEITKYNSSLHNTSRSIENHRKLLLHALSACRYYNSSRKDCDANIINDIDIKSLGLEYFSLRIDFILYKANKKFNNKNLIKENIVSSAINKKGDIYALGFKNGIIIKYHITTDDFEVIENGSHELLKLTFGDKDSIVYYSYDNTIKILKKGQKESRVIMNNVDGEFDFKLSPSEKEIYIFFSHDIFSFSDDIIYIMDVEDLSIIKKIYPKKGFVDWSFNNSGSHFSLLSSSGEVILWDTKNFDSFKIKLDGRYSSTNFSSLRFSEDDKYIIANALPDEIIFHGIDANQEYSIFPKNTMPIVDFIPISKTKIAIASVDLTIKIIYSVNALGSTDAIVTFDGGGDISSIFYNKDEGYLIIVLDTHDVKYWKLPMIGEAKKLNFKEEDETLVPLNAWDFPSKTEAYTLSEYNLLKYDSRILLMLFLFLWQMEEDGFNFTKKSTDYSTEIPKDYLSLLNPPETNETKMGQIVRWLEDQKAYRKTPAGVPQ